MEISDMIARVEWIEVESKANHERYAARERELARERRRQRIRNTVLVVAVAAVYVGVLTYLASLPK